MEENMINIPTPDEVIGTVSLVAFGALHSKANVLKLEDVQAAITAGFEAAGLIGFEETNDPTAQA